MDPLGLARHSRKVAFVSVLALSSVIAASCGSSDDAAEPTSEGSSPTAVDENSDQESQTPDLTDNELQDADQFSSCENPPATTQAKAAYVVMPGYGPESLDVVALLLASEDRPAGIFINADIDEESGPILSTLQSNYDVLLAIDEEGGVVQRIENVFGELEAASLQAQDATSIPNKMGLRGEQLAEIGINLDFAPVVDLRSESSESVIGSRAYGETHTAVTANAGAAADALRNAGVTPTLKHFPGHGRASGDSHDGLVVTPEIHNMTEDLAPFRELSKKSPTAVMMGHLDVPGLTFPGQAASVSPAAYAMLRDDVGFNGVAITDDLAAMKAITNTLSPTEAGVEALGSGADIVLYTDANDFQDVVGAIASAIDSGQIPPERIDEAVTRIRELLGCEPA